MNPPNIPPDHIEPLLDPTRRDLLVAAGAGALVSLLFLGERFTWKLGATAVVSGLFMAYFGGELVAAKLHLDPGWYSALGAAIGFAAMPILGGAAKLLRMLRDDPIGTAAKLIPWLKK